MANKYRILLPLVILLVSGHAAADTMRCGGKIVKVGMSADEIVKYCGQPTSKEVEEHDVLSAGRVVGKTQLNIWTYNRGSTGKPKVLEFDQDQLIAIQ